MKLNVSRSDASARAYNALCGLLYKSRVKHKRRASDLFCTALSVDVSPRFHKSHITLHTVTVEYG